MKPRRAFAAAAAAAALAACSATPAQPAPPPSSPSHEAAAATKPPVVGVNLYAVHNETTTQTTTDGTRTLAYIKGTLHATAVDLVWNLYAPNPDSDKVTATTAGTLTPSGIAILTRIARKDGLSVEYRPIMFIQSTGGTWEGALKPASPAAWFASYYQANLPYLRDAQQYKISEYVIGTEMNNISPDPQWPAFLARTAKTFTGQISYTADQGPYFYHPNIPSPPTRLTGVDMYESLRLPSHVTLADVTAAWERFFTRIPAALLRRTAIQETGIEARAGAYANPPNLRAAGRLDQSVQYDWFTAGCETVRRFHLRGIYFWKVDLADHPLTHPASSLSTFEGREGANAISHCESIIRGGS